MSRDLERALDALYAVPPSEFTAKRKELADGLAAPADAKRLRAARKPTVVAFVLNQLARRHPSELSALVDVGRELARAQRKALRGEGAAALRELIAKQRGINAELAQKAAALVRELELGASAHLDAVDAALHAALVDPAVGEALEAGRLDKAPERAARGFGADIEAAEEPPEPKLATAKKEAGKEAEARRKKEAAEKAARAKDAAEKAARAKDAAEKAARAKEAEDAAREAEALAKTAARLRNEADAAERAASAAKRRAKTLAASAKRSG